MQRPPALLLVAAALLLLPACRNEVPTVLAGESAHFRLHVDTALEIPSQAFVDAVLGRLETNWRDTQTLLGMPEGGEKIEYHAVARAHVSDACGGPSGDLAFAVACQIDRSVYVPELTLVPMQHELNHVYMALRSGHVPAPVLVEGLAEAIGCAGPAHEVADADWREVVASTADGPADIYAHGAALVHHLIGKAGIDAFLRYYEQAPNTRAPDAFDANFRQFWSHGLDDVWAEMRARPRERLSAVVTYGICPCSVPPLEMNGTNQPDAYAARYWRLPDLAGETAVLQSESAMMVQDCAAETTLHRAFQGQALLARVPVGHYASGYPLRATQGPVVADSCESASPYDPSGVASGEVGLLVSRPDTRERVVYLRLATPAPMDVRASVPMALCGSCGFDPAACPVHPPGTVVPLRGDDRVRLALPSTFALYATAELTFSARAATPAASGP